MARIKGAFVKEVLNQYDLEQISFIRMVELINEEANRSEPESRDISGLDKSRVDDPNAPWSLRK